MRCDGQTCPAAWIQATPNAATFTLYDYSSGMRGAALGSVNVRGQSLPSNRITASRNPCFVTQAGGTCTTYLSWNTNAPQAQVIVAPGDSTPQLFTQGPSCASTNCPASWIRPLTEHPQGYLFVLLPYQGASYAERLDQVWVTGSPLPSAKTKK